jgi:predicted metal-binding protein
MTEIIWHIYKTINGENIYPIGIGSAICKVKDVIYEPILVRSYCLKCVNYNRAGGCPPRAPKLEGIARPDDPVWLIYCLFLSQFNPPKVAESPNVAIHWKFQDALLSRFLVNIGWSLLERTGGTFLSNGYCQGCHGKKCNFKLGFEYCGNPKKRTYSMEATGINVVKTVDKCFGVKMFWYNRNNIGEVPYLLKCMALFPNAIDGKEEGLLIQTLNGLKSSYLRIGTKDYISELKTLDVENIYANTIATYV